MLLLTSCARHEGFHNCEAYPGLNYEMIDFISVSSSVSNRPITSEQGLQVLMGTQGVLTCDFTGM